jgi:hypothetical protein
MDMDLDSATPAADPRHRLHALPGRNTSDIRREPLPCQVPDRRAGPCHGSGPRRSAVATGTAGRLADPARSAARKEQLTRRQTGVPGRSRRVSTGAQIEASGCHRPAGRCPRCERSRLRRREQMQAVDLTRHGPWRDDQAAGRMAHAVVDAGLARRGRGNSRRLMPAVGIDDGRRAGALTAGRDCACWPPWPRKWPLAAADVTIP